MATIINNPPGVTEDSSLGMVVGLVVALVLIVLFFIFVWPSLGNPNSSLSPDYNSAPSGASTNVNVTLPTAPSPAYSPATK